MSRTVIFYLLPPVGERLTLSKLVLSVAEVAERSRTTASCLQL